MKDILILVAMGVIFVWGYHLMGRLDRFLDTHIKNDEEDETNNVENESE